MGPECCGAAISELRLHELLFSQSKGGHGLGGKGQVPGEAGVHNRVYLDALIAGLVAEDSQLDDGSRPSGEMRSRTYAVVRRRMR